jgi:hypothetical protein
MSLLGYIPVRAASAAFTANGGADGFITVTSNADFFPGAFAWVFSTTQTSKYCIITELSGSDKIGVRFFDKKTTSGLSTGPSYIRDSVAAFLLADGARIEQEAGVVPVFEGFVKKDKV